MERPPPSKIPQLAPQFQVLPQNEAISSIPTFNRNVNTVTHGGNGTHVTYVHDSSKNVLYQDYITSNFIR